MPDRGFRNDMKVLPIKCSLCEWNGLFKDYEVKYYILYKLFLIQSKNLLKQAEFLSKMCSLNDLI